MPRRLPAAEDILAAQPPERADGAALRASARAMRAAGGVVTGVLDDDPTGSQSMHGVQVVTGFDAGLQAAALNAAGAWFVLTNTRSLAEPAAAAVTASAARGMIAAARGRCDRIQLVSRSDSTLRGHVVAEVAALQAVRRELLSHAADGVLLIPAFLEAGRLTAGDIHWARGRDGRLVPVGETEFARDAAFGYSASDLRDFLFEKSGGAIARRDVRSISLADIRTGGPERVRELLAGLTGGAWAVVNAAGYADLETVACGVLMAEMHGQSFVFRTGPSFVRALTGTEPCEPLRGKALWPGGRRGGNGLIVVGSHVGQTSRQVTVLRQRTRVAAVELSVPAVLASATSAVTSAASQVSRALAHSDVLLYTSREVAAGGTPGASLEIARAVSAAVARTVRLALPARPAWVVAKGGITSHDVALHGLRIRRAEVAGQLLPGAISVFRPVDALAEVIGMPYVVFAGNVGDDGTLAQVAGIMAAPG